MRKFLSILLVATLSLTAFATDGTNVTITPSADSVFVKLGETPDISATVSIPQSDGSVIEEAVVIPEIDTDTVGRQRVMLSAYGVEVPVYVTVMNEDADMSVYRDITKIHWGYKAIRRCVMAGIMGGVSESRFAPENDISRAEFCQMIYNLYKNEPDIFAVQNEVVFDDVTQDAWYYDAVNACASGGIILGDNGKFSPSAPITRQDVALIMMRIIHGDALNEADSDALLAEAAANGIYAADFSEADDYAKTALAASLGVIYGGNEKGEIMPKSNITRAECAMIISNLFFEGYNDPEIKKLVYLSPSRQIHNPYKSIDTSEGEQMYIVADYTKAKLEEMGYDVYIADIERYIKYDDCRADEAKALGADVYVAIHSNAIDGKNNGKENGAICFYNGNNVGAKELAQAVYDRISALTPTEDNGIENDALTEIPFAEIRLPEMANILLEVEYHDYYQYAKWIVDNVQNIGEAIALGIDDYFKLYNI